MRAKNYSFYYLILIFLGIISCQNPTTQKSGPVFQVSFSSALSDTAFDGRLLLMLSTNDEAEPRFQISDRASSQQVFGIDVEGMKSGEKITIDASAF